MSLYFILPLFIAVCGGIMYFGSKMQNEEREQKHRHEMEKLTLDSAEYNRGWITGYRACMEEYGIDIPDCKACIHYSDCLNGKNGIVCRDFETTNS